MSSSSQWLWERLPDAPTIDDIKALSLDAVCGVQEPPPPPAPNTAREVAIALLGTMMGVLACILVYVKAPNHERLGLSAGSYALPPSVVDATQCRASLTVQAESGRAVQSSDQAAPLPCVDAVDLISAPISLQDGAEDKTKTEAEEGKDAERCTPLLISTPPLAQSPRSAAADRAAAMRAALERHALERASATTSDALSPASPLAAAASALAASASPLKAEGVCPEALHQLLKARRSVYPKDYTGEAVPDAQIAALLSAARWAPNHGKTQPWRFVVFGGVQKEALLHATLEWHLEQPPDFWQTAFVHKGQPEFPDGEAFAAYFEKAAQSKWRRASHLVAICRRRQRPSEKKRIPEWEETAAVACAVQNMHLLATSLQLGAYWSSWYELFRTSPECVRFLGLEPEQGDVCMGVLCVGAMEPDTLAAIQRLGAPGRLPPESYAVWHGE